MASTFPRQQPNEADITPPLEWRVHLARRSPGRTVAVSFMLAAAALLALAVFQQVLPALLTLVALLAAISEFLFPVAYRLTATGITRRCGFSARALPWNAVKSCHTETDGIRLISRAAARSVLIRFPESDAARERLQTLLRVYCAGEGIHAAE